MNDLREIMLESARLAGVSSVGVATVETLAGGPESADLTRVLDGAKSAIVFALPLDPQAIKSYLSKKDRMTHERDNLDVNTMAAGVALNLAGYLEMKGHKAHAMMPNNFYRTDTPMGALDMAPDVSLRYLAVRAGIGWFGLSGNVITPDHGAGVILGAVITTADFAPTDPLPAEDNYCNKCRLCMATCLSGLMDKEETATVTLGGKDFSYSKRKSYLRCEYVCGGFTGLHPSGAWSTWSPGRFPVPENDDDFMPVLMNAISNYGKWPRGEGGYYHVLSPHKMYLTCGNCQLVCHPDPEERKARFGLLKESGVVVQNADGSLEPVSPEQAKERMAALNPEQRALYESS
ncbi:MAG: epoxyqueuosine reductase [Desulfatibacillum sp.]|nr:epoxyqueuosine reductase [Desulfatibacillum sp.]